MKYCLVILCLLGQTANAAEVTEAEDRLFINQLNNQLDRFGRKSNVEIRYDDVRRVDEPMFGAYLSLVRPRISHLSKDVTYTLTARHVALYEENNQVTRAAFPRSLSLTVTQGDATEVQNPSGPTNNYDIVLDGVPKLWLKHDRSHHITHYRFTTPAKLALLIESQDRNTHGSIVYTARQIAQTNWTPVNPIASAEISAFFQTLIRATLPHRDGK